MEIIEYIPNFKDFTCRDINYFKLKNKSLKVENYGNWNVWFCNCEMYIPDAKPKPKWIQTWYRIGTLPLNKEYKIV